MPDMLPVVDVAELIHGLAEPLEQSWDRGVRRPAPGVWLIVSGALEEWRSDVLLAKRGPGELIGDLEMTQAPPGRDHPDPQPYATSWMVRSDTRVRRLDEAGLWRVLAGGGAEATLLYDLIVAHGRQWRSTAGHAFDRFAWARLPAFEHLPKPPPYKMPDSEVFLLPVMVPASVMDQIPPFLSPVRPDGEGPVGAFGLIIVRRYERIWSASEDPPSGPRPGITQVLVAVLVKQELRDSYALFIPWLFSNNALSMFIGREIFGMPAMFGSLYTQRDDPDNPTHIHLVGSAGGKRSFDLTLDKATPEQLADNNEGKFFPAAASLLTRSMLIDGQPLSDEQSEAFFQAFNRLAQGQPFEGGLASWSLRQLAWKRNFQPSAQAAPKVPWDPKDFAVDALTASYMSFTPRSTPEMWFLGEPAASEGFPLLLEGEFHTFKPISNLVMRARMDVLWEAALRDGERTYDINYRSQVRLLLDDASGEELAKLAWGPAVWGDRSTLPRSPVPPPLPRPPWHRSRRRRWVQTDLARLQAAPAMQGKGIAEGLPAILEFLQPDVLALEIGEVLYRPADEPDRVYWVIDGLVDEWRGNQHAGTRGPGQLFGQFVPSNEQTRDKRGVGTEAQVSAPCRLFTFPLARFRALQTQSRPWGPALQRVVWLTGYRYVDAALDGVGELEAATFQVFPGARAVVLPGPYAANSVTQYSVPVLRNAWMESLLPPRLRWHPLIPNALLVMARFEVFGPAQRMLLPDLEQGAAYNEAGLMIPVQLEGSRSIHPRLYIPWIFPTSLMAMFAGREIYGYPKSWATVRVDEDRSRILVRRNGVTILNLRHKPIPLVSRLSSLWSSVLEPVTFLVPPDLRSVGVDGWKRNFSPNARVLDPDDLKTWKPSLFDVDQQAGSGFQVDRLRRAEPIRLLEPTIQLKVPHLNGREPDVIELETLLGFGLRIRYGLTMTTGEVLLNYLGATTDLSAEEREALALGRDGEDVS